MSGGACLFGELCELCSVVRSVRGAARDDATGRDVTTEVGPTRRTFMCVFRVAVVSRFCLVAGACACCVRPSASSAAGARADCRSRVRMPRRLSVCRASVPVRGAPPLATRSSRRRDRSAAAHAARPLVDIETLERPIVLKKNDETQYIVSLKIQRSRTRAAGRGGRGDHAGDARRGTRPRRTREARLTSRALFIRSPSGSRSWSSVSITLCGAPAQ